MSDIPKLPEQISPDGREIWDWAGKLSEHVHRLDEIRRLTADINRIQLECGSCEKWMTKSCPKEKLDSRTGRKSGPSGGTYKCNEFVMNSWATELMQKWQRELNELRSKP